MSHVTFIVSHVFFFFFLQNGKAYRWRVCCHRGLPRHIFNLQAVNSFQQKSNFCSKTVICFYIYIMEKMALFITSNFFNFFFKAWYFQSMINQLNFFLPQYYNISFSLRCCKIISNAQHQASILNLTLCHILIL